jgi:hypothetical protein
VSQRDVLFSKAKLGKAKNIFSFFLSLCSNYPMPVLLIRAVVENRKDAIKMPE